MKQINVAVVGLSGVEKDKGQAGVGKSCLCNRFVRPLTDDYFIDHISVLSQSDFSGRVVNNDHFLYWGEVKKTSEEGVEYSFQVVEQTEFIDDATFTPFKVGKMEPYYKRCASIRIQSAEKLMYICKNQLGIEREYEQVVLPDGRLIIDGFICVFDVSLVPNRSIEKQVEYVHNMIQNLLKTKKPIVLVTTKNDDATDVYVREAEKLCQRKEYKNSIVLIETSAHESINIDLAFIVLAQLVEKTKNRSKILTYHEAARIRKDMLDQRTEYVTHLIRSTITDYRSIWTSSNKKLLGFKEWQDFLELFGQEAGQRIFRRHIKKLREEHSYKKLQGYLGIFANILQEAIPDLKSSVIEFDTDWNSVRNWFRNNMDFDQYFYENDAGTWADDSDEENADGRIPFEVLDTTDAETVFKNHLNLLQREQKRLEWKKQFKKLLEETGYVTPGKQLSEVRVLFMGRECFEALSEHDCQQIYDNHQREIIESAKHNFQELLLEHADLFYHFKSIEPSGTITQNDIKEITDVLQEDLRYKLLDRLDQDRKLMLFQHLGFVHCPIREHCPAFPGCIDSLIERIVITSNQGLPPHNRFQQKDGQMLLNLLIIGLDYVSNELIGKIHLNCNDNGEYIMDGHTYNLNIETINRENDSFSFDLHSKGIVCVFSNRPSFQYIVDTIEKQLLDNVEFKDEIESFHIVLVNDVCKSDEKIDLNAVTELREEAQQLAERLGCIYIDGNDYNSIMSQQNQERFVDSILNTLIENIPSEELKYRDSSEVPDIRIILSMFCGDPYSVENIINALISESSCVSSGDRHVTFELFLGDCKRRVEVILSSYHGANAFRDELVHGFILLYSTKRKASLATLNAFSMNIPNLPMQIVAITEPGGVNSFFNNEVCQILITEGNSLADKLHAHFATSSDEDNQFKFAAFAPFLKEVWDKKPEIEHAFHMEEPLTIDSGEGTMEHSMHHHVQPPQPPPRFESYMPNGTFRQQRDKGLHIRGDDMPNETGLFSNMYLYEDNPNEFEKDDRGRGMHLHKGFQMYSPPNTPPEPAPDVPICRADLLTPSSILRQLKENNTAASQSSLDEINCWLDDSFLIQKQDYRGRHGEAEDIWRNQTSHRAFTTGRRPNNDLVSKKVRPKGPSQTLKQPGKLNLKSFAIVNEAIARMNLGGEASGERERKMKFNKKAQSLENAPLAAQENDSEDYEEVHYEQINEHYNESAHLFQMVNDAQNKTKMRYRREKEQAKYSESESDSSSPERRKAGDIFSKVNRKPQSHKRMRKKRVAIPVQPPTIPLSSMSENPSLMYQKLRNDIVEQDKQLLEEESSIDISPRDTNSPMFGVIPKLGSKDNEREKLLTSQKEKKTWFRDSSESKKSTLNNVDAKQKKKTSKAAKGSTMKVVPSFASFKQSENSLVPLFLEKCVHFIEQAGLDSEGIYRVPGNRAHVDLLYQKFDEDSDTDIDKLDIPVNAVATALKDFFSKHLPPLFDPDSMNELEEIAGTRSSASSAMNIEVKTDKSCRLISLRNLLSKLPPANFSVLKFIFQHFVRVAENSKLNSMDSKNLAICWWPTLLPIEFTDMLRFESMRPYLEDIVQTMIDQYPFLFCGKEAFVMV